MSDMEPLIKLDPEGKALILNYNIPEPTSYFGTNIIELDFDESYFKEEVRTGPDPTEGPGDTTTGPWNWDLLDVDLWDNFKPPRLDPGDVDVGADRPCAALDGGRQSVRAQRRDRLSHVGGLQFDVAPRSGGRHRSGFVAHVVFCQPAGPVLVGRAGH